MKLISPDRTFLYYLCDRNDGMSHGIRISRAMGAVGFVSDIPSAQQRHPVPFSMFDDPAVRLPAVAADLPPILQNALGEIEDMHPEIHEVLSGQITFDDALRL